MIIVHGAKTSAANARTRKKKHSNFGQIEHLGRLGSVSEVFSITLFKIWWQVNNLGRLFGDLGVTCSPRDPRFAGSNPAEVDGFFQGVKILRWGSQV